MRKLIHGVTAALLLACAACSNGIYPVSGTVTYKGAPAAGAAVYFHRRGADSASEPPIEGIVQTDGSFELLCGSLGQGAPPGEYDVLVEWKRAPDQKKQETVKGCCNGRLQTGPDRLKGRYADRKRPLLHATIEARATQLPAFELTDGQMERR